MGETATAGSGRRFSSAIPHGTAVASSFDAKTMVRLTDAQRTVLTQALPAVAHLALGALVFGQFLREEPYSLSLAVAGIAIWLWFVGMAVAVAGGKQ